MSLNVALLKGNLTRDPEIKKVGSGDRATSVANFTIAVNRNFKRQNGEWDKETTYVDCEAWDSGAERLAEYCHKGDPLLVQGSLKLDIWETDGQKRSKLKVRVNSFERLNRAPAQPEAESQPESQSVPDAPETAAVGAGDDPEIPF